MRPFALSGLVPMAIVLAAAGCVRTESPPLSARLVVDPSPPRVGPSELVLELADELGPLSGARVELEAGMTHPGMVPVFASGRESGAGRYEATLEFTMAGDWFVLVTATTRAGEVRRATLDIPRVAPGEAE